MRNREPEEITALALARLYDMYAFHTRPCLAVYRGCEKSAKGLFSFQFELVNDGMATAELGKILLIGDGKEVDVTNKYLCDDPPFQEKVSIVKNIDSFRSISYLSAGNRVRLFRAWELTGEQYDKVEEYWRQFTLRVEVLIAPNKWETRDIPIGGPNPRGEFVKSTKEASFENES